MHRTRAVEMSSRSLAIALTLVAAAAAAYWVRDSWLPATRSIPEENSAPSLSLRDPAASRAEEIAVALQAIDYRDPEGWLNRLRPLTTDFAYNSIKTAYLALAWRGIEQGQIILAPDQVTATDQGVQAQGALWQVRRVLIHIEDAPPEIHPVDRVFLLQLINDEGEWKLQAVLTRDQVSMLQALPTRPPDESWRSSRHDVAATPFLLAPLPPGHETDREPASLLAEQFAITFTALDYRDQAAWLARLRPLSQEAGFNFLRLTVAPQLWPCITEEQVAISPNEVVAVDLGIEAGGETPLENWQIRRVRVEHPVVCRGDDGVDEYLLYLTRQIDAEIVDPFDGWRFAFFVTEQWLESLREAGGQP